MEPLWLRSMSFKEGDLVFDIAFRAYEIIEIKKNDFIIDLHEIGCSKSRITLTKKSFGNRFYNVARKHTIN